MMKQKKRVFVTGRGAVSSSGMNTHAVWDALLTGQSGITEITSADLSAWTYRLGGELKEYQPAKLLPDRKLIKALSRQDVLGIQAAMQAVEDSQILDYRKSLSAPEIFNDSTAIYVGSPGNKYNQQYDFLPLMAKSQKNMYQFAEQLFTEVHPMWLLRILPNNVLAYVGITYEFKGENHNIVNHAVSGMQAILEAYQAIQAGLAERAVVVAYDVGIEPQALFYYERLGVLSARHLKPFDQHHDGTILAEGAAALVLESEASIQARGGRAYAEVLGGRAATEGGGLFTIEAQGAPLKRLLQQTLAEHALTPQDLGFIVAHGNGNPVSDLSEATVLTELLDRAAIPVTAFKWSMGHTLCASGVLDTVLAVEGLHAQLIPGIANLQTLHPACQHLNIAQETRSFSQGSHALIINRGFAGMNAALVLKACD